MLMYNQNKTKVWHMIIMYKDVNVLLCKNKMGSTNKIHYVGQKYCSFSCQDNNCTFIIQCTARKMFLIVSSPREDGNEMELIQIPTIIRHVFKLYSYNRRVHLTALGTVRRFYGEWKTIMGKKEENNNGL